MKLFWGVENTFVVFDVVILNVQIETILCLQIGNMTIRFEHRIAQIQLPTICGIIEESDCLTEFVWFEYVILRIQVEQKVDVCVFSVL